VSEFWIYFEKGFRQVFNLSAFAYILFLVALVVPYLFKDWKKLFALLLLFTAGHSVAVLLSFFGVIIVKSALVKLLNLGAILVVALLNLFTIGKSSKQSGLSTVGFLTLFCGILEGLLVNEYFKTANSGSITKLISLFEYSTGIHAAQILITILILLTSYCVQTVFRFSKRDWTLGISAFIIGVILPIIIKSGIWNK
jgi:hypothetical protein